MSNIKFTPGPWKLQMPVNKRSCYAKINAENWGGLAYVVVRMKADNTTTDSDSGITNARLITAAPKMYELLKYFLKNEYCGDHAQEVESLLNRITNE